MGIQEERPWAWKGKIHTNVVHRFCYYIVFDRHTGNGRCEVVKQTITSTHA